MLVEVDNLLHEITYYETRQVSHIFFSLKAVYIDVRLFGLEKLFLQLTITHDLVLKILQNLHPFLLLLFHAAHQGLHHLLPSLLADIHAKTDILVVKGSHIIGAEPCIRVGLRLKKSNMAELLLLPVAFPRFMFSIMPKNSSNSIFPDPSSSTAE